MKKLIVSGCSYTAKEFLSSAYPDLDTSWPKWPELLGKKLNMKVVNLAFEGAGNRFILQTLLEAIERTSKDKIGLVIAAWSQSNRDDWQYFSDYKIHPQAPDNFKWSNNRIGRPGDVFSWVKESLLGFITLQNVCKRYNIPYKQFQMIGLFEPWIKGLERVMKDQLAGLPRYEYKGNKEEHRKVLKALVKDYEQFIDTNNFLLDTIEVPLAHSLNDMIHRISKIDEHPNEQGQQKLAKIIYEKLG